MTIWSSASTIPTTIQNVAKRKKWELADAATKSSDETLLHTEWAGKRPSQYARTDMRAVPKRTFKSRGGIYIAGLEFVIEPHMHFSFEHQDLILTILSHSLYQFDSEINDAIVLLDINKL